jgi:DNA-binding NtrC family response regulator
MAAQSAIRIYEQHPHGIDLVVTDMFLPGQSGEQLGHKLREQSREIAVLITPGYAKSESEMEACEARTYFPAKPYSRRALLEKVNKILAAAPLAHTATQPG